MTTDQDTVYSFSGIWFLLPDCKERQQYKLRLHRGHFQKRLERHFLDNLAVVLGFIDIAG
jgi:hypothetical protein